MWKNLVFIGALLAVGCGSEEPGQEEPIDAFATGHYGRTPQYKAEGPKFEVAMWWSTTLRPEPLSVRCTGTWGQIYESEMEANTERRISAVIPPSEKQLFWMCEAVSYGQGSWDFEMLDGGL
jgi:hypothetical protein